MHLPASSIIACNNIGINVPLSGFLANRQLCKVKLIIIFSIKFSKQEHAHTVYRVIHDLSPPGQTKLQGVLV